MLFTLPSPIVSLSPHASISLKSIIIIIIIIINIIAISIITVSVPEMLLAGHSLIIASLDFLMVAQCASLLHKVVIEGWMVLDLPWVKGWVTTTGKLHVLLI